MSKVITIHSFRGGTGKSNVTANLATLLAMEGQRVGVVDTDIQSPGIHVLFGLPGNEITRSLNDYLWERCNIEDTVHDVTANLGKDITGKLFFIPSSIQISDIVNVLREGYDINKLTEGIQQIIKEFSLDVFIIDTHPGLKEETLFSLAISHVLGVVMRPDQQDYEGTGVTIEVARTLKVPKIFLIVNKTPPAFNADEVKEHVEKTYNCEVASVLPHSEEMMNLASSGIFVTKYPDHPMTSLLKETAIKLIE